MSESISNLDNGERAALRQQIDEARRRAESLRRVIELISGELELETLLTRIIESATEITGAEYGSIGLVVEDSAGLRIRTAAVVNLPLITVGSELQIDQGMMGHILRVQQPVRIDRYADLPQMTIPSLAENAVVGIPIWWSRRLIGVLSLGAHQPHRFSDDDEATLIALARHAAVAVENARLFDEMQRALEATRLLYDVSRRLGSAMSVTDVIRAYLEEVAARGRYVCTVALYEFDRHDRRSGVQVMGVWNPAAGVVMQPLRIPYTHDALDDPLEAGETVTIADVHRDPRCSPELRQVQAADQRPALALIPLLASNRRIGLVILSYIRPHDWPPAELRIYQTTAAQLASAIDSRQQHSLLAERSRQVAVFEERRRLARELHDSVTQSLFSMSLLAQVIPDLWRIDQAEAARSLDQVRDLTRGALAEMRELLYELRPDEAPEQDLAQALRTRSGAFERRTGIKIQADLPQSLRLPSAQAHALLRIAQEALTNIDHHAQAAEVRLTLQAASPLLLQISDNGRGFDPTVVAEGRLGLISMRERAQAIGADLQIVSAPGAGTSVRLTWQSGDDT